MAEKLWYEMESVPSNGIAYPENWKISITPFSFGDVLNFARAREVGVGAFKKMMEGIKCNFDKGNLLPADVLYLGLYRKLVSTKHCKIEFESECPVCAKTNKKVMELKDLKFKDIEVPALPIIAELEAGTLEFQPITMNKFFECHSKHKDDPMWMLAYSVTNMTPEEARVIIMEAVGIDKEVIEEVVKMLDFGLKPIEFECQDEFCDNIISVQLENPETVVFPFRGSDESPKRRIKFGHESSESSERSAES